MNLPGFHRGEVPARPARRPTGCADEAARDAIPEHILAAFRERDVKTLGCPSVEITNWADCESLRYTAEVDVRPRITTNYLSDVSRLRIRRL